MLSRLAFPEAKGRGIRLLHLLRHGLTIALSTIAAHHHPAPKPLPPPTSGDLCLGYHESTNRPHIIDPPYTGEAQWAERTWQLAEHHAHVWYSLNAAGATQRQQAHVLNFYLPVAPPGTWPAWELSACGL